MQLRLYPDRFNYGSSTFAYFWEIYPRKVGKVHAYRKFTKLEKSEPEAIKPLIDNVKAYVQELKENRTEEIYIFYPATYLIKRMWERDKTKKLFTENYLQAKEI